MKRHVEPTKSIRSWFSKSEPGPPPLHGEPVSLGFVVDLRGIRPHGGDLREAYFRGADLSRADQSGADLSGASPSVVFVYESKLSPDDFPGAEFSSVILSALRTLRFTPSGEAIFQALGNNPLVEVKFQKGDLHGIYFISAKHSDASFTWAKSSEFAAFVDMSHKAIPASVTYQRLVLEEDVLREITSPAIPLIPAMSASARLQLHLDGLDRYHGAGALVMTAGAIGMITSACLALGPLWAGFLAGALPTFLLATLVHPEHA